MTAAQPNYSLNAQRAFAAARQEAARLANNYTGAEHLFLGLLSIGECGAAKVLRKLGLEIEAVRNEVERRIVPGNEKEKYFPFTPRARRILKLASEQAKELDTKSSVGTEHILLGVLCEADSLPARALHDLGITLERVRQAMATG